MWAGNVHRDGGVAVRDRSATITGRYRAALLYYGAELNPDGRQVWFRITAEAVCRMREKTPLARGERLIDALLAWLTPDQGLKRELNRFEVLVSDDGDTWIERLRW